MKFMAKLTTKMLVSLALLTIPVAVQAKKKAPENPGVKTEISGVILVDQDVVGKMPAKGTLFVFARALDSEGGPPIAVKKIDAPQFPVEFVLGPNDVMIPGTEFKGKVKIIARLTATPNALDKKGAIEGELPSQVGNHNLKVKLNKHIEN